MSALNAAKRAERQRLLDNPPAPARQQETPPAIPEEPKPESVSDATICTASDANPPLDVESMILKIKEHSIKAFEGIGHMIKAGELLLTLKRRLPHGQFIKMSMEGTGLSRSTIGRYMQMAENVSRVGHLKSGRDALETIAKLNEPPPPPAPRQSSEKVVKGSPFAGSPVQDAVIVKPSDKQEPLEEPEPVILDGTKEDQVDPSELLLIAIKEAMPDAGHTEIYHAVERLIFVMLHRKLTAEQINNLTESINTNFQ